MDMKTVEFTFDKVIYTVRIETGQISYRDKAHLGGPWSDASKTAANKSIKLGFRRKLITAIDRLRS